MNENENQQGWNTHCTELLNSVESNLINLEHFIDDVRIDLPHSKDDIVKINTVVLQLNNIEEIIHLTINKLVHLNENGSDRCLHQWAQDTNTWSEHTPVTCRICGVQKD